MRAIDQLSDYRILVADMRKAQKTYFATFSNLAQCQQIERLVDTFTWTPELVQESEAYQFVKLVREMRQVQHEFSQTQRGDMRRKTLVAKAKQLESKVDKFKFGNRVEQTSLF